MFLLIIMDNIYFWIDTSNFFNTFGFYTYTDQQVDDFKKNDKIIRFKKLGPACKMNDLAYALYKCIEFDIIANSECVDGIIQYSSHHHT